MKKLIFISLLLISCSNSELEALREANKQLAAENMKLKAENEALLEQSKAWKSLEKMKSAFEKDSKERSQTSSIKANMHTLQTALETFAVDWGGIYPKDINQLIEVSKKEGYYRELKDPLTGGSALLMNGEALTGKDCERGAIYYKPIKEKEITKYNLTGCGPSGNAIEEGDHVYVLSNY